MLLALIVFRGSGEIGSLFTGAQVLAVLLPLLIVSLSLHEFAHAAVAKLLGDDTAERQGRLTLNPIAHLDPLGTFLLILTIIIGFGIGWAKPVPVNPWRLKAGPRAGMGLVAIAGPIMNLLIAFVAIQVFKYAGAGFGDVAMDILDRLVRVNIALAIFNMIPIPPLDGFRVLMGVLPDRMAASFAQLEQYGPMLLMLIVFMGQGILGRIIGLFYPPIIHAMLSL